MKNKKTFQLLFWILICVLVSLIGLVGIYQLKNGTYKNILPEYLLASDIKGSTVLEFEVDTTKNDVYYDKDGKKIESSDVTEENKADYTKVEEPVNKEENLTLLNYKNVLYIMKERLKFLRTDQYQLDLDKTTGKIVLTFEDDYPDDIKSILPMVGALEIKDSNTNDVILDSTGFESVEATYASVDNGYNLYLNFNLNQTGIEKVNNFEKYKTTVDEETGDTTTNKFVIEFDEDKIVELSYDAILLVGKSLRVATHEKVTNNSTIQSSMNTNTIIAKLATIGKMPLTYRLNAEEFIGNPVYSHLHYIIYVYIVIGVIISLYLMIRFKIKGLIATISFITITSLFLIVIRLTNIPISMNGMAVMFALLVCNTIFTSHLLIEIKNTEKVFLENVKNAYLKSIDVFFITLIVFMVLAFSNMTTINSAGLLFFWGWLCITLGNLLLTIPMLAATYKE